MTQEQFYGSATIREALRRAEREHITVLCHGVDEATGETFYTVSSSQGNGAYYTVTVRGKHLVCNCQAAHDGNVCKHRCVVTQHMMQQAAQHATMMRTYDDAGEYGPANAQAAYAYYAEIDSQCGPRLFR